MVLSIDNTLALSATHSAIKNSMFPWAEKVIKQNYRASGEDMCEENCVSGMKWLFIIYILSMLSLCEVLALSDNCCLVDRRQRLGCCRSTLITMQCNSMVLFLPSYFGSDALAQSTRLDGFSNIAHTHTHTHLANVTTSIHLLQFMYRENEICFQTFEAVGDIHMKSADVLIGWIVIPAVLTNMDSISGGSAQLEREQEWLALVQASKQCNNYQTQIRERLKQPALCILLNRKCRSRAAGRFG